MMIKLQKRKKGISLLEIMVSIMLFTTVMMTFAMVFPSGYRLNLRNQMESQAASFANGVLYKINNVRFFAKGDYSTPSVENLANWPEVTYKSEFDDDIPYPFYIPDDGIQCQILDTSVDGGTMARITVTIAWNENRGGNTFTKTVSVTGYRSRNH